MSYEVLARKWRPQTFDEVVGQDHISRTLKRAVESNRLSHAYLFSGPRGCGKTSTARILAKVINCTNLENGNPCNECASCVGVTDGKNLDVMEIDGASHTGINEVRDLQESIGYVPSQFQNKVYIIDEVHMLSTHAFNALLKTLEEPPAHVYFIFATTSPHKIPDTIKSRCQRHQFKRLEIGDISDHLDKICKAEKVKSEKDALRLLARKAEGSMRDAQSLLDQCITASSGEVKTGTVRDILGLLDQEMVVRFLSTMSEGDATAVLTELDSAVREGVDLEELLNGLVEGYRDLMLLAVPGDLSDLVFRSTDETKSFRGLLDAYEISDLVTIIERLCNVAPRLKMASDPRILLESTLVDLTLLDRQTDIRTIISSLESHSGGMPGGGASGPSRGTLSGSTDKKSGGKKRAVKPPRKPTKANGAEDVSGDSVTAAPPHLGDPGSGAAAGGFTDASPAADSSPGAARLSDPAPFPAEDGRVPDLSALDFASFRRLWDGFTTVVRQKKAVLGVSLISGSPQSFENDTVTLRFAKGFSFQKGQVEEDASKKFLKRMAAKYFGREIDLVCVGSGDETTDTGNSTNAKPADSTPRGIDKKPLIKKILDDFDGEIVRYGSQ
ncbi:MAG: DNA polymerase III subunit gamma/tau [Candidatus Latescibacterota bacterium]|nr:MAG: DNA polymerase III subunit gamma/tau [Candidatus Latescibacterota bacterium]